MANKNNQSLTELMLFYNQLDTSVDDKRLIAVTAALELIKSDAQGGNADLAAEIKNLSRYADQIQKALSADKSN